MERVFTGLGTADTTSIFFNFVGSCNSYNLPGISQDAIRLGLNLFSLMGETTLWLTMLPQGLISNW